VWGLILNFVGGLVLVFAGFPANEYTREGLKKHPQSFLIPAEHGKLRFWLPYFGLAIFLVGFLFQLEAETALASRLPAWLVG
jgi:hypothetical protein